MRRRVLLGSVDIIPEPADLQMSFLDLIDTPDSYVGQGGKIVAVKSNETGLEFTRNLILGAPVRYLSGNATLNDSEYVVVCLVGNITITLTWANERVYFIKNMTDQPVTIVDSAGRLLDTSPSFVLTPTLAQQFDSIMVVASTRPDTTQEWLII